MREVTNEWIFKAEGDYHSAEALLMKSKSPKLIPPVFIASSALKNM